MRLPDTDTEPWNRPDDTADDDRADEMSADAIAPECPVCGGPLVLLGQLGNLAHFRCRNCGMDVSSPAEANECPF